MVDQQSAGTTRRGQSDGAPTGGGGMRAAGAVAG